jgi:hypothetical protein
VPRARATMRQHLPPRRADWSAASPTAAIDVRITMPPMPLRYTGRDSIRPLMAEALAMGVWRLIPVSANRMPAAASYLRRPGDTEFRAFKFDVMRIEDDAIEEITTFDADLFPAFGLARVFGRALGARDLALGLGTLAAFGRPDGAGPWIAAGALSDALDVAASVSCWRELPRVSR